MKNTYKILLITIMLMAIVLAFAACNDTEVKTALDTPTNIAASGSTISWSAVEDATSYDVIVADAEAKSTENTYYNLDLTTIGSYLIKIRAVGKNSEGAVIYSEYAEYTFVKSNKLDTPSVTISGKTATWAAVQNAASYDVKVVDSSSSELYSGTQSELSFSFDDEKYTAVGKYTIQVKAIPEATKSEYANSDAGLGYYYITTQLSAPSITSVSSTAVRWTSISGITSYKLYLYQDDDTLVSTYTTTSNSYAFSYMALDNYGKYYCKVQSIGDGEVYLDSEVGPRVSAYDLLVIPTIDASTVTLYQDANDTWKLLFHVENTDKLSSVTISLTTTKADSSSSMSAIEKTLEMIQGESNYALVSDAEFNSALTYYVKNTSATGYIKNTKPYDALQTYYTFDGAEFKKATVSALSSVIEYYVKVGDPGCDYYEQATGVASYTEVNKDTAAFNTRNNYYTRVGDAYELVTSTFVNKGKLDELSPQDTTTVYFTRSGDVYTKVGTYSTLTDENVDYYAYKSFTAFDSATTYYSVSYEEFKASDYTANTFYKLVETVFDVSIDDLFFEVDTSGNYTYKKTDIAYYGRIFDITVSASGVKDSIITGKSIAVDGTYVSYRKPNVIDKDVAWTASPLQGYFKTEAEYNDFVSKYDEYYAVESIGDMQYMAIENDGAKYVLMQDLDAEGYYWYPIEEFKNSIFDGNNHMISNIVYKSDKALNYQGLFVETNDCEISNLYIVNASNEENALAFGGGIAGIAMNTTFNNCYVEGKINMLLAFGGITSAARYCTITNCQTSITATNVTAFGGIADYAAGCTTQGVITSGSLTLNDTYFSLGDFDDVLDRSDSLHDVNIYILDGSTYKQIATGSDHMSTDEDFKDPDTGDYYDEYYVRLPEIADYDLAGGIFGIMDEGTLTNSSAQVSITINAPTRQAIAGGAVAWAKNGTIKSVSAGYKFSRNNPDRMTITVNALNTAVGGFIGKALTIDVENCYSTIRVAAKENLGGFIGLCDGGTLGSTITNCYATGGVTDQIATNKGYFAGKLDNSENITITNCFVYDWEHGTSLVDPNATTAATLDAIKSAINDANAGSLATISGYLEPVIVGNAYATAYTDSIKSAGKLNVEPKIAIYDSATQETTVINMYSDEDKVNMIVIGDKSAKGTAIVVYQLKVDQDNDGVDDGTGARVAILVTVS